MDKLGACKRGGRKIDGRRLQGQQDGEEGRGTGGVMEGGRLTDRTKSRKTVGSQEPNMSARPPL